MNESCHAVPSSSSGARGRAARPRAARRKRRAAAPAIPPAHATRAQWWEAAIPPDLLPIIAGCLHRIATWRVPPNWSVIDWLEEVKEVLCVATLEAKADFDPARGIPFDAFLFQRGLARVLTRYRQEWTYGLRFHSPCSERSATGEVNSRHPAISNLPEIADPASDEEDRTDCEALAEAVAALPEPSRRLILRLFYEERPEREVAEEFGISQPAISQRKQAVLRELRRAMEAGASGSTPWD